MRFKFNMYRHEITNNLIMGSTIECSGERYHCESYIGTLPKIQDYDLDALSITTESNINELLHRFIYSDSWIPREKQLPYRGQRVLIYHRNKNIYTADFESLKGKDIFILSLFSPFSQETIDIDHVTHWMRLPYPPKRG